MLLGNLKFQDNPKYVYTLTFCDMCGRIEKQHSNSGQLIMIKALLVTCGQQHSSNN